MHIRSAINLEQFAVFGTGNKGSIISYNTPIIAEDDDISLLIKLSYRQERIHAQHN